jgi:hypothetical protein
MIRLMVNLKTVSYRFSNFAPSFDTGLAFVGESPSPNAVTFLTLDSVGETFGFDRAGRANTFRSFDGNLPGLGIGVVFGPKDFRDLLTTNTTSPVYRLGKLAVGQVLS